MVGTAALSVTFTQLVPRLIFGPPYKTCNIKGLSINFLSTKLRNQLTKRPGESTKTHH